MNFISGLTPESSDNYRLWAKTLFIHKNSYPLDSLKQKLWQFEILEELKRERERERSLECKPLV